MEGRIKEIVSNEVKIAGKGKKRKKTVKKIYGLITLREATYKLCHTILN